MKKFTLRRAYAAELERLVAIDDAASKLYSKAGLTLEFDKDHPFVVAEKRRWARAIEQGLTRVAVTGKNTLIGFAALGYVNGDPYLDQLAVDLNYMRCGVGTALLKSAILWSGERPLWLTTYAHLPWNKPFYETQGFVAVDDGFYGNELCAYLAQQRAVLPDPHQRIVMRRTGPKLCQ